jgi:hypothetical protein
LPAILGTPGAFARATEALMDLLPSGRGRRGEALHRAVGGA